eukprot:2950592-Rhodomonas_salina.1
MSSSVFLATAVLATTKTSGQPRHLTCRKMTFCGSALAPRSSRSSARDRRRSTRDRWTLARDRWWSDPQTAPQQGDWGGG